MNKLCFTLNASKVDSPIIEISEGWFLEEIIAGLRQHTSIDLEIITCKKEYFIDDDIKMVRYTFENLSNEKKKEFESYSKTLYIAMNNAINHAHN